MTFSHDQTRARTARWGEARSRSQCTRAGGVRTVALLFALASTACLDFTHNDSLDEAATRALLERPPPFARADVAVVLGCPADDVSGEASPCQRCRVKSALRAYRAGLVGHVIFSGGAAHNRFIEAETMARLARLRGLPESAITLEPRALTTWMNLRYSRRLMRAKHFDKPLMISTASHLPRVERFNRALGIVATYRACDWDLPADSDEEWRAPLRPGSAPAPAPHAP